MHRMAVELSPKQVVRLVRNLPVKDRVEIMEDLPMAEKAELVRELSQETWSLRYKDLLYRIGKDLKGKKVPPDDEIVAIVKSVRRRRHAQSHTRH